MQAWFLLVERYGVQELLGIGEAGVGGPVVFGGGREEGVLERLKRGLGKLVDCFHFGAVMDVGRFWEVVEEELGVPKARTAAVERAGNGTGNGKGKEVQQ